MLIILTHMVEILYICLRFIKLSTYLLGRIAVPDSYRGEDMTIGGKEEKWSVSLYCHTLEVKLSIKTDHKELRLRPKGKPYLTTTASFNLFL